MELMLEYISQGGGAKGGGGPDGRGGWYGGTSALRPTPGMKVLKTLLLLLFMWFIDRNSSATV